MSFLIQTLGCKLNQLESEALADAFLREGFIQLKPPSLKPTSIIIINTCTVTSKADQKVRRVIRKALKDYPGSYIIVTGCYAQLESGQIQSINTDRLFVFSSRNKERLLQLPQFLNKNAFDIPSSIHTWLAQTDDNTSESAFQFNPERFSQHTRGFLKIQDGCDKQCTYCRIRLARGRSVSLEASIVLQRLRFLEKDHSEAVLTGVNICQYQDKTTGNLTGLLEYLLAGTEKINIRLSSLAPDFINDQFTKIISHKRIRSHFHLSIQSANAEILSKMGRSYNRETLENALSLLRSAKNDPFLACDIITGFPGETENQFKETFDFCQKAGFAWIHVFPYSKRPGTKAINFFDAVHEREITGRVRLFTGLARESRLNYTNRWIGRNIEVLAEKGSIGLSENYLKVLIRYKGKNAPLPGTVFQSILLEKPHTKKAENYDAIVNYLTKA